MSKMAGKLKAAAQTSSRLTPKKNIFETEIEAQMASAGPPLGPLLGQYGINIANFCKDFNEKTKNIKKGIPLPITVRVKPDRSYEMKLQTPPISYYVKQAAGVNRCKLPIEPWDTLTGKITIKHAYEIAKIKYEDPHGTHQVQDFPNVVKDVVGIAFLNGIEVVRDLDPQEYEQFLKERNEFIAELIKAIEEEMKAKLQRA